MRRMRTGRDAAPEGSVSSTEPPGALGDTARPNYMGPSGNGLVGADERGGKPAESRAFRMAAPVCSQKAVSGSKEKRRSGAPRGERPSHWACAARRIDVTRAFRRSAPLTFGEGAFPLVSEGMEMPALPAPCENRGGGALTFSRRPFET